jgi:Cd2+/Zn2+-exporting ATPase
MGAVAGTGMRAEPWVDAPDKARDSSRRARRTGLTVVSGLSTAVGFGVHVALTGSVSAALGSEGVGLAHAVPVAARIAYALAIVTGVWRISSPVPGSRFGPSART